MTDVKPGPELDALVAEKVMGLDPLSVAAQQAKGFGHSWCPAYSTDISAAWEVVEKFQSDSCAVNVASGGDVLCRIMKWPDNTQTTYESEKYFEAVSKTAPHAICLAALDATAGK